jgi:sugar-specific transcriptional regulator TrmB
VVPPLNFQKYINKVKCTLFLVVMSLEDIAVQTISQLGLTVLEARIYCALCRYGMSTVKPISELARTSKPDTYRVLYNLQKKSLVEKIIDTPARFRAVSFDVGIALLLKRKKAEYDDLQVKSNLLRSAFKEKTVLQAVERNKSHFAMIPSRETVVKRIRRAIDKSKKTVDLFLTWKRFSIGVTNTFAEACERAWARSVNFRIIVEKPEKGIVTKQILQFCRKTPFCSLRFFPNRPKTVLGIYDKNEAFIIVEPQKNLYDSPALWSNNKSLMSVVKDYFEIMWLTAMEETVFNQQKSSRPLVKL